jgi:coenzyme F420-0:L-glutamate ligase / coenzyme F420-1:gamma-L-glutamate ligase
LLLPADPDASARRLRDALTAATGADLALVIADSDGRPDRLGATVISLVGAGIAPLRVTEHTEPHGEVKRQEETLTNLLAATGIVLGQLGRDAPVAIIRGVTYQTSDNGMASMLRR